MIPPGTVVDGRWSVGRHVASGSSGEVYEGQDLDGSRVAVKVYRTASGPRHREIDLVVGLGLPGIMPFVGYGRHEGAPCLVTRWIEGEPFGERRLPADDVAVVLIRLLERLERLARVAGVVHGDIKPENVLLGAGLVPVVIDLDVASRPDDPGPAGMGTLLWAAPEVLVGLPPTPATDLFGAGMLAWQALTGCHPFPAPDRAGLQRLRLRGPPPTPPAGFEDHPLITVLLQMLQRTPQHRPAVAEALRTLRVLHPPPWRGRWPCEPGVERGAELVLDNRTVMSLFDGPERLLRLRSRAARVVLEQTGGVAALVDALVWRWVDEGSASWEGGLVRLTPAALDQLEAEPDLSPMEFAPAEVTEEQGVLLDALGVAWPSTSPAAVSAMLGRPVEEAVGLLQELASAGLVVRLGDDRWRARAATPALRRDPERALRWHAVLMEDPALDVVARLRHRLAVGGTGLVQAAVAAAAYLTERGRPHVALAWLERAAERARRDGADGLAPLGQAAIEAAIEQPRADSLAVALRINQRCGHSALVEVARAAMMLSERNASDVLAALPLPPDGPLLLLVARVRAAAVHRLGVAEHRAEVRSLLLAVPATLESAPWRAEWSALLLYREERFEDAVRVLTRVEGAGPAMRLRLMLQEAAAWLETPSLERAAVLARRALQQADEMGFTWALVRAKILLRMALYRIGESVVPEPELPQVARTAGWSYQAGLLAMTEACFALRAGDRSLAMLLCRQSVMLLDGHSVVHACICRALLAFLTEDEALAQEVLRSVEQAEMPAGVRIQVLGLCRAPRRSAPDDPRLDRTRRREVLSLEEAFALMSEDD